MFKILCCLNKNRAIFEGLCAWWLLITGMFSNFQQESKVSGYIKNIALVLRLVISDLCKRENLAVLDLVFLMINNVVILLIKNDHEF